MSLPNQTTNTPAIDQYLSSYSMSLNDKNIEDRIRSLKDTHLCQLYMTLRYETRLTSHCDWKLPREFKVFSKICFRAIGRDRWDAIWITMINEERNKPLGQMRKKFCF